MIAFVCHPYHRGGVTSWIKECVEAAAAIGIDCKLVTVAPVRPFISGKHRPSMVDFVQEKEQIVSEPADWRFELGTFDFRVKRYRQLIESNIPDGWMLIPSDDEACWAACAQLGNRYKVVGVLHSDDAYYYQVLQKYKPYLAAATGVSQRILKKANAGKLPSAVIPCGINTQHYASTQKQQVIAWVGRLEERQKRVTDIIPIAIALQAFDATISIEVYGHGEMDAWLADEIVRHQLTNLKLMGWQDAQQIAKALAHSKILLQTSNFEGMSVAVMEALAAGCVIVSSRVSGVEDLEAAPGFESIVYLFEIGNVQEAVQQLIKALQGWDISTIAFAMQAAEANFSIRQCLNKYADLGIQLEKTQNYLPPVSQVKSTALYSGTTAAGRLLKYSLKSLFS